MSRSPYLKDLLDCTYLGELVPEESIARWTDLECAQVQAWVDDQTQGDRHSVELPAVLAPYAEWYDIETQAMGNTP